MSGDESSLDAVIKSSITLLECLKESVRTVDTVRHDTSSASNALDLATKAATLLKAQITKLSLLCMNEPFTSSEIIKIIRSLTTECFPALLTAGEAVVPQTYSRFLHQTIHSRIVDLCNTLPRYLQQIPRCIAAVKEAANRPDTLQHTGQIWASCDFLISVAKPTAGIRDAASKQLNEWKGLATDATDEIEQWQEDGAELLDDRLSDRSSDVDEMVGQLKTTTLDPRNSDEAGSLDGSRSGRSHTASQVVKCLRLINMLYSPLIKRRIQKFPQISGGTREGDFPSSNDVKKLDFIMDFGKAVTENADLMAELLYTDQSELAGKELRKLDRLARECVTQVAKSWDGKNDEFTAWLRQWSLKLEELQGAQDSAGVPI